jgi:hypothetical protein
MLCRGGERGALNGRGEEETNGCDLGISHPFSSWTKRSLQGQGQGHRAQGQAPAHPASPRKPLTYLLVLIRPLITPENTSQKSSAKTRKGGTSRIEGFHGTTPNPPAQPGAEDDVDGDSEGDAGDVNSGLDQRCRPAWAGPWRMDPSSLPGCQLGTVQATSTTPSTATTANTPRRPLTAAEARPIRGSPLLQLPQSLKVKLTQNFCDPFTPPAF